MVEKLPEHTFAWTKEGRKVYIEAITTDGEYVVSGMVSQIYGDETYEEHGEIHIHHGTLYASAPVTVVDEDIKARKAVLDEINKEIALKTAEARNAEKDVKDRIVKLSKYSGLERLESFIDGKITHFVVIDYNGVNIKTFDEIAIYRGDERRNPDGVKLLTLFGDSKGDLSWRLDQYRVSSSSDMEVIPCTSEEEAISLRNDRLYRDLENAKARSKSENIGFYVMRAVSGLRTAGLDIPEDALAIADIELAARKEKERESICTQIQQYQDRLNKLETQDIV